MKACASVLVVTLMCLVVAPLQQAVGQGDAALTPYEEEILQEFREARARFSSMSLEDFEREYGPQKSYLQGCGRSSAPTPRTYHGSRAVARSASAANRETPAN